MGIPSGVRAPPFSARAADRRNVDLKNLLEAGPVLVAFHRGDWCSYSSYQLAMLASLRTELAARGVELLVVTASEREPPEPMMLPDVAHRAEWLIVDRDLRVHRAFHIVDRSPSARAILGRIQAADPDDAAAAQHPLGFAVPAIFLIDQERVVRFAHADLDHTTQPSRDQILGMLDRVGFQAARDE